jgi:DNA-binding MarR family transcriptional regulator
VTLFATDPSPISSAELAEHAGITRSAITDVLDRLEADRLIRRHRDTADRRIIYVTITEQGRAEVDAALTRFIATAGQVAQGVPAASFDVLHESFTQLETAASSITRSLSSPICTT